jgi:hypothetical protein
MHKSSFTDCKALSVCEVPQSEQIVISKASQKLAKALYSKLSKNISKGLKIVQKTFTLDNIIKAYSDYESLSEQTRNYTKGRLKLPLYQNLCNPNFLLISYSSLKSKPSSGIDSIPIGNVTLASLISLSRDLKTKKYKPKPTKRIFIPKANGKTRPLGIASSRDKIVQQALKVVLVPPFERIFLDFSHGFRPKRSCHTALNTMYSK